MKDLLDVGIMWFPGIGTCKKNLCEETDWGNYLKSTRTPPSMTRRSRCRMCNDALADGSASLRSKGAKTNAISTLR